MISMVFIMSARAQASGSGCWKCWRPQVDIIDKPRPGGAARQPGTAAGRDGHEASPRVAAGKVEFRDVSFKYSLTGTGENVLSGISFAVEPGEVVGIVGGTGSGKSTLVNLIPRLYDVTEGAVLVDGIDVRDYALEDLRGRRSGWCCRRTRCSPAPSARISLWGRDRRYPGGDRDRLPGRPGTGFHPLLSQWIRHRPRAGWREPLRRAETAPLHRPRHPQTAQDPDPRR